MRNLLLVACFVCGCGSGSKEPGPADLSKVEVDLASVADLARVDPPDMTPVAPPDLAVSLCTQPLPGIYEETEQYNYVLSSGGVATGAGSAYYLVVRNDGSFERPAMAVTSPNQFHCMFTGIDPMTCMAACCPGQPGSPMLYFDKGGWTMWLGGTCQFTLTSGLLTYIATVTDVEGYFQR